MRFWILLFLVIIPFSYSQIYVSEIMANPLNGSEWVELYTEKELNFSKYYLKDNYMVDEILCCFDGCDFIVPENSFFVIAEIDATEEYRMFCVDDGSIGNGLGNNEDKILIFSEQQTLINFSYNFSLSKGVSLSLLNNTYLETVPTPNSENIYLQPAPKPTISLLLEKGITNQEHYLFRLENDYGEVNSSFMYNISLISENTTELICKESEKVVFKNTKSAAKHSFSFPGLYLICGNIDEESKCSYVNITDSSKTPCNISLWIEVPKQIYSPKEKIEYYIKLNNKSFSYDIEYWIEDIFGKDVKSKYITHNTNKKTYTPKFQEREKPLLIKAKLNYISCNNSAEQISDSVLIAVQGDPAASQDINLGNKIELELDEKESFFGEIIYPKIKISKGDTSKYAIKIYLMKNNHKSEPVSFYAYGKNKEYELKLPFLISHPNNEEGEHFLVIEGLDLVVKKSIHIKEKNQKNTDKENIKLLYYDKDITNQTMFIVEIENKDPEPKNYFLWSYLYSGPKSYSGNRTFNSQNITLQPFSSQVIVLKNTLTEIPKNELKAKINIQEENEKTPIQITKNISYKTTKILEIPKNKNTSLTSINQITGDVIYKSSSEKIKDYSTYFLILVILLSIYALMKIKRI